MATEGSNFSNFSFLEAQWPELAQYGALAEKHALDAPVPALQMLRAFGERVAAAFVQFFEVKRDFDGNADRINFLRREGLITPAQAAALHQIRMHGNVAVHEERGDTETALRSLKAAYDLGRDMARRFRAPVPADSFTWPLPKPTPDLVVPVDQLKGELKALSERLKTVAAATVPARDEILLLRADIGLVKQALERQAASAETSARSASERLEAADSVVEALQSRISQLESHVQQLLMLPPTGGRKSAPASAVSERQLDGSASGGSGEVAPGADTPSPRQDRAKPQDSGTAEEATRQSARARAHAFSLSSGEWLHIAERSGWKTQYVPAGGRLRSRDMLESATPLEAASAIHAVMFSWLAPGRSPHASNPSAASVAYLMRRIVTRGDRPPVDPDVERALLDASGVATYVQPAKHEGDLAQRLHPIAPLPNEHETRAALLHRVPFRRCQHLAMRNGEPLLDDTLERPFYEEVMSAVFGDEAGHWCVPQASLESMLRTGAAWHGRRVDFLFLHPQLRSPTVIEIDGAQHTDVKEVDAERDRQLTEAGVAVMRLPGKQALSLAQLPQAPRMKFSHQSVSPSRNAMLLVWGPAIAHRVTLAIAEALDTGLLDAAECLLELDEPTGMGTAFVRAALELADALAGLTGVAVVPPRLLVRTGEHVHLLHRTERGRFETERHEGNHHPPAFRIRIETDRGPFHELEPISAAVPEFVIRPVLLPVHPRLPISRAADVRLATDPAIMESPALKRLLQGMFAKRDFQPEGPEPRGQEKAIRRLLTGRDTVVLLPTGAGKSLIYQFVGLLRPGLTLTVDPLVSLIDDQLDGLRLQGIDRAIGITHADTIAGTTAEKLRRIADGEVLFAFISPERLQSAEFREAIREFATGQAIATAVVDEAHCVSEWGHDFRTAYLDLGRVLRDVCQGAMGAVPPLLALTGTASRSVLKDMLIELSIDRADPDVLITPEHFDRKELYYRVIRCDSAEMLAHLRGVFSALPSWFRDPDVPRSTAAMLEPRGSDTVCGIVFCRTVRTPPSAVPGVLETAKELTRHLKMRVPVYTGSTDHGEKTRNAVAFKENASTVMVATKAYGIGIDKPNVRYVIHVGTPGSIEAYYQEAGRAGRSRHESHCIILSSPEDPTVHEFFHSRSYRGAEQDYRDVARLVEFLGQVDGTGRRRVPMGTEKQQSRVERAIHRLKLLALITDYTVDWSSRMFNCRLQPVTVPMLDEALLAFIQRSQPARAVAFRRELASRPASDPRQRLLEHARSMVDFVYETIAASRLRAVGEMHLLTSQSDTDAQIRDRILRYLTLSETAGTLERLAELPSFEFGPWLEQYDAMLGGDDARDWRGATARLLESSPDHPGLLIGRGLAEAVVLHGEAPLFAGNLRAGFLSARDRYAAAPDHLAGALVHLLAWIRTRRPEWAGVFYAVCDDLFEEAPERVVEEEDAVLRGRPGGGGAELSLVLARRLRRARRDMVAAANTFAGA